MVHMGLLGEVAKSVLFSAVTGKVVDSVLSSKLSKQNEKTKWLRDTKFEFFTKLSQDILSYDLENSSVEEEKNIKENIGKIVLLVDDKNLIIKLEDYTKSLNNAKRELLFKKESSAKVIESFNEKGINLVIALKNNLKKS